MIRSKAPLDRRESTETSSETLVEIVELILNRNRGREVRMDSMRLAQVETHGIGIITGQEPRHDHFPPLELLWRNNELHQGDRPPIYGLRL